MIQLEGYNPWTEVIDKTAAGFEKGFKEAAKRSEERRKQQTKNAARVRGSVKNFLGLYDTHRAFRDNPEQTKILEDLTRKYVSAGYEPDDAVMAAYEDVLGNKPPDDEESRSSPWKGNPSFTEALGLPPAISKNGLLSDVGKGLKKGGRALSRLASFPTEVWSELQKNKRSKIGKLQGLSDEEIVAKEKELGNKTLLELYDELTGGEGVPENFAERLAQGVPLGAPGVAGELAGELTENIGLPEWAQGTANLITFMTTHKMMNPSVKGIVGHAEHVAKKTGTTPEAVIEKAQMESGVALEDVIAGDSEAVSTLKDKITKVPEVGEKVKGTPKEFFNKKAAIKERETFGSRLPDSPLDYYYESEAKKASAERAKGPEVVAREAEIRSRLQPEEKALFEDIKKQREQLTRMEQEIKKVSGEARDRIDVLKQYSQKKYNDTLERLKDIQYEMRYGRPRPTEAEIDAQIQKSIETIEDGIKNPTEKTEAAAKRQLDLDKEYLDRSSKIIDRGELPGEIRPDTFIKMKRKYAEGYKTQIQKLKDEIKSLKGERDSISLKKIANNKNAIDHYENRIKRFNSDIVNQTDKIKAMRALEKPSGAFYKNQINSLKKDNALFKHDLFKQKKIKSTEDIKSKKVYQKFNTEISSAKKAAENPTKENIQEIAKETGKSENDIIKTLDEVEKGVKGLEKPVKEGTVSPRTENDFYKYMKRTTLGLASGYALGFVQASVEEIFGIKPDAYMMKSLARGLHRGYWGPTSWGYSATRDLFDGLQAAELKKLKKNPAAWNRYLDKLQKKHGTAKVKRVRKAAMEVEE